MALFGKKTCPNCGQPQEKNWDKCPFCAQMGGMGGGMGGGTGMGMGGMGPPGGGMGAAMGGGMGPPMGGFGGPPPPQSTQFGGGGGFGPPPASGGGFGPPPSSGSANKTQMFIGAGGQTILLGWVIPLKGPHRGELHSLKAQTVIGKDPTCDIVFNDSFMSSRHATIRQQGGAFILEDHSSNGTYVNDKKISRHELVDSDFVKLGQTLVKFKCL